MRPRLFLLDDSKSKRFDAFDLLAGINDNRLHAAGLDRLLTALGADHRCAPGNDLAVPEDLAARNKGGLGLLGRVVINRHIGVCADREVSLIFKPQHPGRITYRAAHIGAFFTRTGFSHIAETDVP